MWQRSSACKTGFPKPQKIPNSEIPQPGHFGLPSARPSSWCAHVITWGTCCFETLRIRGNRQTANRSFDRTYVRINPSYILHYTFTPGFARFGTFQTLRVVKSSAFVRVSSRVACLRRVWTGRKCIAVIMPDVASRRCSTQQTINRLMRDAFEFILDADIMLSAQYNVL